MEQGINLSTLAQVRPCVAKASFYDPTLVVLDAPMLPARSPKTTPPSLLLNIEAAIEACELYDGATLSFHHHLRDGDAILNAVVDAAAKAGLRGLTIAASSIFPVHGPLVDHIVNGVVSRILCDYMKGPVASAVIAGLLPEPVVLQSHGGRARAISSGRLKIDAAFVAAPRASRDGAATGAGGRASCGPLGYAMVDSDYAEKVVLLADEIVEGGLDRAEIEAGKVDYIVKVDHLGDNGKIMSGATSVATDAVSLSIVDLTSAVIRASGHLQSGFSFQTGAGGVSLGITGRLGTLLAGSGIRGGFISGGIGAGHVALLEAELFDEIQDVQCFDLKGALSYQTDPRHRAMSASRYASPIDPAPIVDRLDVVVLGAAEVDVDFNINVAVGGNGALIGGPGGHPDTAAGAKLTIVATRLRAGGHAKIVNSVICKVTPGESVDVVVTEGGVAVNPMRSDLLDRFIAAGIPVRSIRDLVALAKIDAVAPPVNRGGRVVAVIENRCGGIRDTISQQAF